jgi:hypothetical protein
MKCVCELRLAQALHAAKVNTKVKVTLHEAMSFICSCGVPSHSAFLGLGLGLDHHLSSGTSWGPLPIDSVAARSPPLRASLPPCTLGIARQPRRGSSVACSCNTARHSKHSFGHLFVRSGALARAVGREVSRLPAAVAVVAAGRAGGRRAAAPALRLRTAGASTTRCGKQAASRAQHAGGSP